MLLCWVHGCSLSPSRKKDGIECPVSKFDSFIASMHFVLFICGENVCRRGLMLLCWVHGCSLSPSRKKDGYILCRSLIVFLHNRAFIRKEDGTEPLCIAEQLSPVGRRLY